VFANAVNSVRIRFDRAIEIARYGLRPKRPKRENAVIRSWRRRRRAATRDGLRHLRAQQLSSPGDQGSPGTVGGAAGLCRVFQIRRPHPATSGKRRSEHDSSRTPKTAAISPKFGPTLTCAERDQQARAGSPRRTPATATPHTPMWALRTVSPSLTSTFTRV